MAPDHPQEWLNRARSNLLLAHKAGPGVYFEDLCFNAQQAAEKALKALLIKRGLAFPYVHDLSALLTLIEKADTPVPEAVRQAEGLTRFAVFTRCPGVAPEITEAEYREAIHIAGEVLRWAEGEVAKEGNS